MQTKLTKLRSELNRLQRQRAIVRWGSAVCAPLAIVLWLLAAAFLCDWSFDLPISPRMIVLFAWIAGGVWAFKKFAWPLIFLRESTEDMALIVEQKNKIDSDLVAALQFEKPDAQTWGSPRLSQAVVDYVAEFSPSLNVFEGFTYRPLPQRATVLGLTAFAIVGFSVCFPAHAMAFWNRFLLGAAHYPTKTQIERIIVSGQELPVFSTGTAAQIRIPYGQPITVEVQCAGDIPTMGFANLSGMRNDSKNRIDLHGLSTKPGKFVGEVANVPDSFRVRFHCGDAISDASEIVIVPLPLVDLAWEILPPHYARTSQKPGESDGGSRQLSVLQGSHAELKLVCSNKPLKSARMLLGDSNINLIPATANPPDGTTWMLPRDSRFTSIQEAIRYEIQVVDRDGLSLETPITGQIRLKPDRLPRIVASAVTRQVLPTAQPKLDYAAGDDFGVAKIVAVINIAREDGRATRHEFLARTVSEPEQPLTIVRGQIAIPLSQYELTKGDEVKVVLEVTDWRGEFAGQPVSGEAIAFTVTDLNGILAQTGEEDKKTSKQLDEILRREMGISGEKK